MSLRPVSWLTLLAAAASVAALATSVVTVARRPASVSVDSLFAELKQGSLRDERDKALSTYAKTVEASVAVTELAWGVATCAEHSGKLPETTTKVPTDIGRMNARMYQAAAEEWNQPAFTCAGFHMLRPQRYRYQWVRLSEIEDGYVEADADFNGDGGVDHVLRLHVRCRSTAEGLRCRPDRMTTEPSAVDVF